VAQLRALTDADASRALAGLLALPPGWTEAAPFVTARNLRDPSVLPADRLGPLLIAPAAHGGLHAALLGALTEFHRDQPDQPGLQPERLRLRLPGRPPLAAFRALVEAALAARQVEQDGPWLRLPTHRATLAPAEERIWAQASALIAAERFRPPRARDLARALSVAEPAMRALLKRCQRMGRLVEVAHDHFFLRETVAEMVAIARTIEDAQGMVVAAAFRDRLDNGRKVAIQILEFFDRQGVTRRHGDERIIRADRHTLFGDLPDLPGKAA
jgi:selenocysteine-specific elongation factor